MNDNIKLYEVDIFAGEERGTYSMVIKADHEPTTEELETFLAADIKNFDGESVELVGEISREEAENFYDMSNADKFPVLTREG